MAAVLDRPMHAAGDAEGTALGAAALGLHALGLSPRLEDAPAMLYGPPSSVTHQIRPDPSLVEVYARTRATLPKLVDTLDTVSNVFRAPR